MNFLTIQGLLCFANGMEKNCKNLKMISISNTKERLSISSFLETHIPVVDSIKKTFCFVT